MRATVAIAMFFASAATAFAAACPRTDFEAIVDEASATLVQLNQKNTPVFQAKLRALKDKRGWSHEQFIKEGAPFVRDDTIASLDDTSQQLLVTINTQSNGDGADCKALADLRAAMSRLVETQNLKWSYMFDKIEKELGK